MQPWRRVFSSWLCPVLAATALSGCAGPPPTPIVFSEVGGDQVPAASQTAFLDTNQFFGPGAAVGDVDGDGRPDLFLAGSGLYLNRSDPRGFRLEAAPGAVPQLDLQPIGVAFADFDRDGDLDLTVAGEGGVRLLQNDGTGRFQDVTASAGVAGPPADLSVSVAWGDLDGDGYLDLAVGNYGVVFDPMRDQQPSHLYLNQRDGTFKELLSPLSDPALTVRATITSFADFDGDGRLDVYFSDDREVYFLDKHKPRHDLVLLNRGLDASGAPILVESSATLGLGDPHATMSCLFGSATSGAGWDLFYADDGAGWLYRSDAASGPYHDVTKQSGIDLSAPAGEQWIMWGGAFADLDGDGFEDLLVGQAPIHPDMPGTAALGPLLLRNDRHGRFNLQRYAFGGPMNARATLLADLDGDGDDDAIVVPFFDRFRFFTNQTAPRAFVRVDLAATVSAPGAVGAVVVATSNGAEPAVQKRMRVSGGQPGSGDEATLDFALGKATAANLTVTWPSGAVQTASAVPAGTRLTFTEPGWITLSASRPPADGATHVTLTVDAAAAGLGGAGSLVHLAAPGLALDATCDAAGVATFDLPPRSTAGPLEMTLTLGGRELPVHPALDYQ